MARILSGTEVADHLNADLERRVISLKARGAVPCLHVIRIGEKPGDLSYERGALRRCEKVGVLCQATHLPSGISQEELLFLIRTLNEDPSVHGVLLLRPLPAGLDESSAANCLLPRKDVDCMTDLSMSGVILGKKLGFAPCTAEAAMAFLDYYGINCTGKRAVVIGRSLVFGKPAALMLTDRNATVTLCHTKTENLPSIARQADILMAAAGRSRMVGADFLRKGQIVIDVGINMGPDQKLCGDVAFDEAVKIVDAITPVPGGVGMVTASILVRHVVEACEACYSQYIA